MKKTQISKDMLFENSLLTSTKFHALYLRSRHNEVKSLITTNEIYHKPLLQEWKFSVHTHELAHINAVQRTFSLKFLALLRDIWVLLPKDIRKDDVFFQLLGLAKTFPLKKSTEFLDNQCTFFSEVHALHHQLLHPLITPSEIREFILSELRTKNSELYQYFTMFSELVDEVVRKKKNEGSLELKRDVSYFVFKEIIKAPLDKKFSQDLFKRFNTFYELRSITPKWRDLGELQLLMRRRLFDHGVGFSTFASPSKDSVVKVSFKSDRAYLAFILPDLLFFLAINRFLQFTLSEPFIFGLLSEFEQAFGPIVYSVNSFRKNANRKIEYCYIPNILKIGFTYQKLLCDVPKQLKDGKLKIAVELYNNALDSIPMVTKEILQSIPDDHCTGKSECPLPHEFWVQVREAWRVSAEKIDSLLSRILGTPRMLEVK